MTPPPTLRAFVAVELPAEVRDALAREQRRLREDLPGARWVRPEGIHLTLHFLGEIRAELVPALEREIAAAVAPSPAFAVRLRGRGVFPSPRRPRVLWIGVDGSGGLEDLQRDTGAALARCGLAPERRPFRPHLTLARFRRPPGRQTLSSLRRILAAPAGCGGEFTADTAALLRSELLPRGARYTILARARLGG